MILDHALYQDGKRALDGKSISELIASARKDGGFVWVGVNEPTSAEFDALVKDFEFHPLAIEDAIHAKQRPKLETYEGMTFVVFRTTFYEEQASQVTTGEILAFIGEHYIVVVRHGEGSPLAGVRSRLEQHPGLLKHGPYAVLHAIMDQVIDAYIAIAAELEKDVIEVEQSVFSDRKAYNSEKIYFLKRELLEFRHAIHPLLVPLQRLAVDFNDIVPDQLAPFFRDTLDHLHSAVDIADGLDDLLTSALSADLAHVQVQQNEDMRKITSWVALASTPTMMAGIYGMNFKHM
ncbi:MAG: magnesium and cobalt transport protein CorA, partial [Candidatus Planktophila sp.]